MRITGAQHTTRGRGPAGGIPAAWWRRALVGAVCCTLLLPARGVAQATPAGTQIRNWASVSYETQNGTPFTSLSDTVTLIVGQVAGADLEPPRAVTTDPGTTAAFAHTLVSGGNGTDDFDVVATSRAGWTAWLYRDTNRDGTLDAGDVLLTGPVTLAAGDTAFLLVAVNVPPTAPRGGVDTVDVQAASRFDPAARDVVADAITVRDVGIAVALTKAVDRPSATTSDLLTYTVTYDATGPSSATNFELTDVIPAGTTYLPGTLRLNGAPLTDAPADDAGSYDAGLNRISVRLPTVAGGDRGTVSLQVRMTGQADASNIARAGYVTIAGTDSVISNSVQTVLLLPHVYVQKLVTGPVTARVGDEIEYRIRYGNTSASVTALGAEVNDTLPAGLEYASAVPAAVVSGATLTWTVGDLVPGASAEIVLRVRVSPSVTDTTRVRNAAFVALGNAPTETALAPEVVLLGGGAGQLAVAKTADVLEVGLGETVPYTVTVQNTGGATLADLRIQDRLPAGGRLVAGTPAAADSVQGVGRDVIFFLPGTLVPGETQVVRYVVAIVSAEATLLQNVAVATAEAGTVRSDPVAAWVRVRTEWPMATRAAIGRVWLDANANDVQDPGEAGIEGVDLWTADGEVATTDAEGRFSYRNLRTGRHAFRLDQTTLPAGTVVAEPGGDLVVRDADGWTSPRIVFRVVPQGGRPAAAPLPVSSRFTAELSAAVHNPLQPVSGVASVAVESLAAAPAVAAAPESVTVAVLRRAEEREAERQRAFLAGPGVEVFAPADGRVFASDRVFVGVRGEPGARVELFDGATPLAPGELRLDGVHDFIAIPLSRGPHRLRVRMINSWRQERWDSLAVHVTGRPTSFVEGAVPLQLVADGQSPVTVRVRVLDEWGVPVVGRPLVTVAAEGAEPLGRDADPSSVGHQLQVDEQGWLTVELRPGREVRRGALRLEAGAARRDLPLELLPAMRPLMVTGVGRVGFGASPGDFGTLIARGRLDEETALVLSYDSRRLDAGRDVFGRSSDPLEAAQYPLLGDASQHRSVAASQGAFSARLERGFDWLAAGDITTEDFAPELTLAGYRRALPGAAGRITTGTVVWTGFGSTTSQQLEQLQIRGAGISGPYFLRLGIEPGTERVVVETRAAENAERILAQQVLARFVDYQVDYERGTLLFKRPVPAADPYGNPVFLVVTFETAGGGPRAAVWGLRAAVDARGLVGSGHDSLRLGTTWVEDAQPGRERRLVGADLRLVDGRGLDLKAEVAHSQTPDSSGLATAVEWTLALAGGLVQLSAGWMMIDPEFANPSSFALRGGTEELKVGSRVRVGPGELRLEHSEQHFDAQGVERQRTSGSLRQPLVPGLELEGGVADDRFASGLATDASQAGELKLSWKATPALTMWGEGRRQFSASGTIASPDHVGAGLALRVRPGLAVEARHRQVFFPGDSGGYAVTNLGVRSQLGFGTEMWGSYQIAGVNGAQNAAVVGLNNRLRLGAAWSLNTLFERRQGVGRAAVGDPVRALPFIQAEEDYWSLGLGVELLPPAAPYRLSARSEWRDGDLRSSRLATLAGDVSLHRSLAVLSRQEFLESEQVLAGSSTYSRQQSSLWGVAFRPVGGDALNVLTKLEWVSAVNPAAGGVLAAQGRETRTIVAAEAIWAPARPVELAGRYATRRTGARLPLAGGGEEARDSRADYVGARAQLELLPWLGVRGEGRLLIERTTGTERWDAAPQLVLSPIEGLELAGGQRFGTLRDPDFAAQGGPGWFVTVGARLTERSFPTAAAFWRSRLRAR